jgi:hypothetical protein
MVAGDRKLQLREIEEQESVAVRAYLIRCGRRDGGYMLRMMPAE